MPGTLCLKCKFKLNLIGHTCFSKCKWLISYLQIEVPLVGSLLYLRCNGIGLRVERRLWSCVTMFSTGQAINLVAEMAAVEFLRMSGDDL